MPAPSRRHVLASAAVVLAAPMLGVSAIRAQTPLVHKPTYDNYVLATLRMGEVSIAASQLAVERAQAEEIRRFAEIEMAEQQTVAGVLAATGVREAAAPGNTALERTPDERAWIDRLIETPAGKAFDLAYVEGQIVAHNDLLRVQQSLLGEEEPTIETITARLVEQGAVSHIATLNLIQQLLGLRRIEVVEEAEG